jgi:hypothetical protein
MIRAALRKGTEHAGPGGGGGAMAAAAQGLTESRSQLASYHAVIEATRALAGVEAVVTILGASAKLARRLKEHGRALSYHREMLALRGRAGAIPETYLVLWTEIATDLQLAGRFSEALAALREAEAQLGSALTSEGLSLVYKQRAFLLDCDGQHGGAVEQMRRGRALAEAVSVP